MDETSKDVGRSTDTTFVCRWLLPAIDCLALFVFDGAW